MVKAQLFVDLKHNLHISVMSGPNRQNSVRTSDDLIILRLRWSHFLSSTHLPTYYSTQSRCDIYRQPAIKSCHVLSLIINFSNYVCNTEQTIFYVCTVITELFPVKQKLVENVPLSHSVVCKQLRSSLRFVSGFSQAWFCWCGWWWWGVGGGERQAEPQRERRCWAQLLAQKHGQYTVYTLSFYHTCLLHTL
jgi:hypothetical protein